MGSFNRDPTGSAPREQRCMPLPALPVGSRLNDRTNGAIFNHV
jgi:hypothetical protein